MAGFARRVFTCLEGLDEAANALLGGSPRETVSGSIGRALDDGKWWAPAPCAVVNALAYAVTWVFTLGRNPQRDHCQATARDEAARRAAEAAQDVAA
jgi:hypothetical protein